MDLAEREAADRKAIEENKEEAADFMQHFYQERQAKLKVKKAAEGAS